MTSTQRPPVRPKRMALQARLMGVVNVPMRLILGLPFATPISRQLMLLYLTGRKSGKKYVQPVSYVPDGDTLLTPGGGRWKLNMKPGECVRVPLRGRAVLARPELIRDVDQIEQLLLRMQSVNPRITSFVPVGGSRGEIDRERVQNAVNFGFVLIRWHFDSMMSRRQRGRGSRITTRLPAGSTSVANNAYWESTGASSSNLTPSAFSRAKSPLQSSVSTMNAAATRPVRACPLPGVPGPSTT
jgi:hypothetical protein